MTESGNPGLGHAGPAGAVSRPRWRPLPLHGGARESPAPTRVPKALESLAVDHVTEAVAVLDNGKNMAFKSVR